jgi:hypothetical protein
MAYVNLVGCDMCGTVVETGKQAIGFVIVDATSMNAGTFDEEKLIEKTVLCKKCVEPLLRFRTALEENKPKSLKRASEWLASVLKENR